MTTSSPTIADVISALAELADWTETRLADENASRQAIVEHAADKISEIGAMARAVQAETIDPPALAADPRVVSAREFLATANAYDLDTLPHSVLVRLATELRLTLTAFVDMAGRWQR